MRSLKTKITAITLIVVIIATLIMTALCIVFIRNSEKNRSEQVLLLLCETGKRNLDYYFNGVQNSVLKVSDFIKADIDGLMEENLAAHIERAKTYFSELASRTNGVLTYYYRIDPTVSENVKGFWYVDLNGNGFTEHEVTDITLYDTSDTSKLVWFTVPKYEGKAIWLSPYITDNLDVEVISYNVPIYYEDTFVGVVGIEIDYSSMANQIENIRLLSNGYAFLNDDKGVIFYHPKIDVSKKETPTVPEGLISDSTFIRYTYNGVKKEAIWMPLTNGMRLNVTVPISEMNGDLRYLIINIFVAATLVILISSLVIMVFARRISQPLKELTEAAKQVDVGNYDYKLTYDSNDELGMLTKTFKVLTEHTKDNITALNNKAFVDALTHVKNKGAFTTFLNEFQDEIESGMARTDFALGVFDCDDLKSINDRFGHDKGDIFLETASRTICNIFSHSPVFRIGGDEFSVILRKEDYVNRDALIKQFEEACEQINASTENKWEQVRISMGFAQYEPSSDNDVSDIVRRADKMMYENKRMRKSPEQVK